jgi:carbamoyl-phosphate synthase
VSGKHPVVASKYFTNALEYDVDLVAYKGKVICYAVSEHIENAGVHSGDATMFLPPQISDAATVTELVQQATKIAEALKVIGPLNVQFLRGVDGVIRVIEANVRSSRSVPFVSKVLGVSFPSCMVSAFLANDANPPSPVPQDLMAMKHVGCKAAMFSFIRLAGADPILGVEMASTGEVGVIGRNKHEALLKAMLCQNFKFPKTAVLLDIEVESEANEIAPSLKNLVGKVKLYATFRTAATLGKHGIQTEPVYMPNESAEHNLKTVLGTKTVQCTIQLRDKSRDFLLKRMKQEEAPPEYWIRRIATDFASSVITEITLAKLFLEACATYSPSNIEIEPAESYVTKWIR